MARAAGAQIQGYTQHHALDILVGLASKLISNFTNAMSHNPPEPATLEYAWRKNNTLEQV